MSSSTDIMRVRLTADGIQDVMDALKKVQNETRKTGDAAKGATDTLGSLGTIFAAQKIASFAKDALDAADQLYKMSQKTGIAVEQLSTFSYVAQQADLSQDDLAKGFSKLSNTLDALASGDAGTVEAFKRIGLSAEEMKGLSLDQVILKVADAQSKFADGSNKTAVMMQIFGKAGANMIPMLNDLANGGFENAKAKLGELGLVISGDMAKNAQDFNDSMTRMEMAAKGVTVQVAQTMLPGMTKAIDGLTAALADMPAGAKAFSGAFLVIGSAATAATVAVKALWGAIAGLGPVGIAVVALSALVAGLLSLQAAEDEAQAQEVAAIERRSRFVASSADLEKAYRKESEALDKSAGNQKEAAKHSQKLKDITDQLIGMSPDLQKILKDETKTWTEKAEAIKKARVEAEKNQELERKQIEADLVAAKQKLATAKDISAMPTMAGGVAGTTQAIQGFHERDVEVAAERVKNLEDRLAAMQTGTKEDEQAKALAISDKADESTGKSRLSAALAASKRALEAEKSRLQDVSQTTEQLYKEGEIDLETYLAARLAIIRQGTDAEVKALQAQRDAEAKTTIKQDLSPLAQASKLADLDAQIALKKQEGERKLQALEQEGLEKRREATAESIKLDAELEAAHGRTGEAAIRAVEAEYDARIRTAREEDKARLQALKENAVARKRLEGVQSNQSMADTGLDTRLSSIDQKESYGMIGSLEANEQRLQAYQQWIETMTALREEMVALADETGDEGVAAKVKQLDAAIEGADAKTKVLAEDFASVKKAGAESLASGLVTTLSELGDSTKTVSDRFRDLGRSIIQSMEQALIKVMLLKTAQSMFGDSEAGSFGAMFISALGKAEGGPIIGPGTATSDSIPAMLSNGEFVNRAASVQYYGADFFDALNGLRIPKRLLPGFANGGLAGTIQANVSPAARLSESRAVVGLEEGLVLRHLEGPKGEDAMLRIIARNPQQIRRLISL